MHRTPGRQHLNRRILIGKRSGGQSASPKMMPAQTAAGETVKGRMRIWFATRPEVAFHLRFRRSSRTADPQAHEKVKEYGRGTCDEERTKKRRPVNRPTDAGKSLPQL